MFARLTFCRFLPNTIREARKIFIEEIAPAVRKQKGNLNVALLEPNNRQDEYISITEWKSRADADAYASSGIYKKFLTQMEKYFASEPVLKTYFVEELTERVDYL